MAHPGVPQKQPNFPPAALPLFPHTDGHAQSGSVSAQPRLFHGPPDASVQRGLGVLLPSSPAAYSHKPGRAVGSSHTSHFLFPLMLFPTIYIKAGVSPSHRDSPPSEMLATLQIPFTTHLSVTLSSTGTFRQQAEAGCSRFCTDTTNCLALTDL